MRLRLEASEVAAGLRGAPPGHGGRDELTQRVAVVGKREVVGRAGGHGLRRQAMRSGGADGNNRHVQGSDERGDEPGKIRLGAAGGDQKDGDARRRRFAVRRAPLPQRHVQLLGEERPKVAEGVGQPDDPHRVVRRRHNCESLDDHL